MSGFGFDEQLQRLRMEQLKANIDAKAAHQQAYRNALSQSPLAAYQQQQQMGNAFGSLFGSGGLGALSGLGAGLANAYMPPAPSRPTHRLVRVKDSPLFGYLRWRYDSPFNPLKEQLIRWAWRTRRGMA